VERTRAEKSAQVAARKKGRGRDEEREEKKEKVRKERERGEKKKSTSPIRETRLSLYHFSADDSLLRTFE